MWAEATEDEILDRGAALAYYFVFAVFPLLLFITALLSVLPVQNLLPTVIGYVERAMPGDAASIVRRTLTEITATARTGLLSVGAIVALWSGSSGMASIMTALNVTYDVEDTRPWWRYRLTAVVLTVVFSCLAIVAAILLVFGGHIGEALGNFVGLGDLAVAAWTVVQWPVAIFCALFGLALVYYLAPAVEQRWYWVTPGSAFALTAWLLMSVGLRVYVAFFANYSATYGSIGGVILLLFWFYLSGLVLLYGAEINAEIEHAAAQRGEPTAKEKGTREPVAKAG